MVGTIYKEKERYKKGKSRQCTKPISQPTNKAKKAAIHNVPSREALCIVDANK